MLQNILCCKVQIYRIRNLSLIPFTTFDPGATNLVEVTRSSRTLILLKFFLLYCLNSENLPINWSSLCFLPSFSQLLPLYLNTISLGDYLISYMGLLYSSRILNTLYKFSVELFNYFQNLGLFISKVRFGSQTMRYY